MNIKKWVRFTFSTNGANARNCAYVHGCPSPSAAWGLAKRMCLDADVELASGVAFVVHQFTPRGQRTGRTTQYSMKRSASRDIAAAEGGKSETQLDLPSCDIRASILFQAESDSPAKLQALGDSIPTRFAGGSVNWVESTSSTHNRLGEALSRIETGFAMTPGPTIVTPLTFEGFIEEITPTPGRDGWRTPSLIGYQLMETPQVREGVRVPGMKHAYADPLVGIVQWNSIASFRRAQGAGLPLWAPKWSTPRVLLFHPQPL